jgi:peptidoglycan/xylan/chitin deacetylase (PgdA/CDA1 family)
VYLRCEGNIVYAVDAAGKMTLLDITKPTFVPVPPDQKTAYITIDDGPSRDITPKMLDTLNKYGVKATFFVLPKSGVDDLYQRIIDEGHALGNHSYSHDITYLYASTANFKKDVLKARDFILDRFGYTTTVFRFPGGTMGHSKTSVAARADILSGLGYTYFDWNVSTADTDPNLKTYGSTETIVTMLVNNVLNNARGTKKLVVLMHDSAGKKYTALALPRIIEGLQEQGYVFDALTNY